MNYGSSKSAEIILLKSIFYVKNDANLSKKNLIEEYQFKCTCLVIGIFWQLQSLKHIIF